MKVDKMRIHAITHQQTCCSIGLLIKCSDVWLQAKTGGCEEQAGHVGQVFFDPSAVHQQCVPVACETLQGFPLLRSCLAAVCKSLSRHTGI